MRTVVEEPAVSRLLDASSQQYPRLADAFEGLKWYLAHRPEAGYQHPKARGAYLYKQAASYGVPSITALYTYDDARVVIRMIKLG
jgi:hypothetical protein